MKKAYSKPVIVFENFELDAAITMTCTKITDDSGIIDAYLASFGVSNMPDDEKEKIFNDYILGNIVNDDPNSKECYFTHSNPSFQS